jgi:hypothetical protein
MENHEHFLMHLEKYVMEVAPPYMNFSASSYVARSIKAEVILFADAIF